MSDCTPVQELIGAYIDDGLPDETRRRVEAHLLGCRDCAWEALSLRIARERLRADVGEAVVTDAFRSRVLRQLVAQNPHVVPVTSPADSGPEQYRLPMGV